MINIYDDLKYSSEKEIEKSLFKDDKLEIKRIASKGQITPFLENSDCEIAILLEGEALIKFESDMKRIKKGDLIFIKPHLKHQVYNISDISIWLAIHY